MPTTSSSFFDKLVKRLGPAAEENTEFLVRAQEQLASLNVKLVNTAKEVAASDDYDAKVQLLSDLMQDVHNLHSRLDDQADKLRRCKTEVFPLDEIITQLLSYYDDKWVASDVEGLLDPDFVKPNEDHPLVKALLMCGPLTRDSVCAFRDATRLSTKADVLDWLKEMKASKNGENALEACKEYMPPPADTVKRRRLA